MPSYRSNGRWWCAMGAGSWYAFFMMVRAPAFRRLTPWYAFERLMLIPAIICCAQATGFERILASGKALESAFKSAPAATAARASD